MKSLEIIDKYIGTVYALSDDELKQIKQDLEVLEILKKLIKKVDYVKYKGEMRPKLFVNKFSKDLEHDYEIEKIKEWLEEQK